MQAEIKRLTQENNDLKRSGFKFAAPSEIEVQVSEAESTGFFEK